MSWWTYACTMYCCRSCAVAQPHAPLRSHFNSRLAWCLWHLHECSMLSMLKKLHDAVSCMTLNLAKLQATAPSSCCCCPLASSFLGSHDALGMCLKDAVPQMSVTLATLQATAPFFLSLLHGAVPQMTLTLATLQATAPSSCRCCPPRRCWMRVSRWQPRCSSSPRQQRWCG